MSEMITSKKPGPRYALAEALAYGEQQLDDFKRGKTKKPSALATWLDENDREVYLGYMADAHRLLDRLKSRGYSLTRTVRKPASDPVTGHQRRVVGRKIGGPLSSEQSPTKHARELQAWAAGYAVGLAEPVRVAETTPQPTTTTRREEA